MTWLEKLGWPAAFIVALAILALAGTFCYAAASDNQTEQIDNTYKLKSQIVQQCATAEDPATCASNIAKALSTVN